MSQDTTTAPATEKPFDHERPAASKYLSGACSFQRFKVTRARGPFGEEHLERLNAFKVGHQRVASGDGVETGWAGGGHVLDGTFGLAKNIVNDALVFDLRIDSNKLPADLLKAYTAIELAALSKDNPSGFASRKQRREAKETARERLEQEAKDGRFLKRKCIPCLWDRMSQVLLFGSTSAPDTDRLCSLFQQTFNSGLTPITAGTLAADAHELDGYTLSPFVPDNTIDGAAWVADDESRDWLGNEFLLWLWWHTDCEGDVLTLGDDSEITVMLSKTLTLECPRAATGVDTMKHEMPNRLPESKRAVQSGKLPRKAALIVVRHDCTYEFTLQAETLAVNGAKLPKIDEGEPRAIQEGRVEQIRDLIAAIDGLYQRFLAVRVSEWDETLGRIQHWLEKQS